jgi:hypothetical protein
MRPVAAKESSAAMVSPVAGGKFEDTVTDADIAVIYYAGRRTRPSGTYRRSPERPFPG